MTWSCPFSQTKNCPSTSPPCWGPLVRMTLGAPTKWSVPSGPRVNSRATSGVGTLRRRPVAGSTQRRALPSTLTTRAWRLRPVPSSKDTTVPSNGAQHRVVPGGPPRIVGDELLHARVDVQRPVVLPGALDGAARGMGAPQHALAVARGVEEDQ